jgi:hypothetical protein
MPGSSCVVYDPENCVLSTVVKYFADANQEGRSVEQIEWADGVDEASDIETGQALAKILWNKESDTTIVAPQSCEGTIESINGKIQYEWLHKKVQRLLCLKEQKGIGVTPSMQQAAKPARRKSTKKTKPK